MRATPANSLPLVPSSSLLVGCALCLGTVAPAGAESGTIWELRRVTQGLHEQSFVLDADGSVTLDVVGAGSDEFDLLHAYGWIIDVDSGRVVWSLTPDTGQQLDDDETWGFVGRIPLDAGRYTAYFNAIGRHVQAEERLKLRQLPWATIKRTLGKWVSWRAYGRSRDWRFIITSDDDAYPVDVDGPSIDALLVDFGALGDNAFESAALRVDLPIDVDIEATLEFDPQNQRYVDDAWLIDAVTGEPVWKADVDDAEPAGGASKNHEFVARLTLEPGEYVFHAITDDSHSYAEWNEAAPWNPRAWGARILLRDGDRDAVSLVDDPRKARSIATIDRVRSRSFVRRALRIGAAVTVRVEGLGELGRRRPARLLDYGWIERAGDRSIVWTMQGRAGDDAGGSPKNRSVNDVVELDAGDYFLCYVTDPGHAFEDWSFTPPREPDRWGIGLYRTGSESDAEPDVESVSIDTIDSAILSLAPTGDDADRSRVMTLPRAYDLRVVALGEAVGRKMYDYGWIEHADTGRVAWEMHYPETEPAGGAAKNRLVDTVVRLQAGRYRVRYKTDDSHAFGSWNADQPDRPELWGITVFHAP